MIERQSEISFVGGDWASIEGLHRFSHPAMATIFELLIVHPDAVYAAQAAQAAFDELDRIEHELSRFVENSDVSRINIAVAGQTLVLGEAAFDCLQIAARMSVETGGAFDVTIGYLLNCWLDKDNRITRGVSHCGKPRVPSTEELDFARKHTGIELLKFDPQNHTVHVVSPVQVDLGGIGKGFALDRMAGLLQDWSIETALVHGGFSTALALDPRSFGAKRRAGGTKGWPVTISYPYGRKETLARISLQNRAVSGSGLQKGQHIIDPRKGCPVPERGAGKDTVATWSCAPDAATADALSTAFMIMTADEIERYCRTRPDTAAFVINDKQGKLLRFGHWQ
jgi:thiamine biosynthesis lipoprotein